MKSMRNITLEKTTTINHVNDLECILPINSACVTFIPGLFKTEENCCLASNFSVAISNQLAMEPILGNLPAAKPS